jgi:hypothetical protein
VQGKNAEIDTTGHLAAVLPFVCRRFRRRFATGSSERKLSRAGIYLKSPAFLGLQN